ncbi:MAG: cupin domain-containing protein [Filimonas sp.]|nr:cupin domain-containing protein [Filimonas sp.]
MAIQFEEDKVFIKDENIEWEQVDPKVKRKIMAYDKSLMMVKVAFETGGVGALHSHFHTQIAHVESGVFEVEVEGIKHILKAGDAYYIPPNAVHGAVCLEAGVLIDMFSPMREDFIQAK